MNAPLLTKADGNWMAAERNALDEQWASGGIPPQSELFPPRCLRPILMLDATWRRLPQVEGCVSGDPLYRGLGSGWKTAYPRINADGKDPDAGLATIEALYVALRLLGVEAETVFSEYRWKNDFLELNRERLEII